MKKRYKFLTSRKESYAGTRWEIGKWKKVDGKVKRLCSSSWLHCYCDPILAVLHDRIHGAYMEYSTGCKLYEVEVKGKSLTEGQIKEGWTEMRVKRQISIPKITLEIRLRYAIMCAIKVCPSKSVAKKLSYFLKRDNITRLSYNSLWNSFSYMEKRQIEKSFYPCIGKERKYRPIMFILSCLKSNPLCLVGDKYTWIADAAFIAVKVTKGKINLKKLSRQAINMCKKEVTK